MYISNGRRDGTASKSKYRSNIKRDIRCGTTSETATSGSIVRRPFGGNLIRRPEHSYGCFLGILNVTHTNCGTTSTRSQRNLPKALYCIEPIERIHYSVTNPNKVQCARFVPKKV